ncbi:hypothetical protein C8J57DRAFT_1283552 [Mycena rebaudengoi]|nr:hypothetical protein C8J57DRAFT_1283552 [Mycena rebaudengoi]
MQIDWVPLLQAGSFIFLIRPVRSQRFCGSHFLAEPASTSAYSDEPLHFTPHTLFLSVRSYSSSKLAQSITITATIAIVAAAVLLTLAFALLWKRTTRKRWRLRDCEGSRRPDLRPLTTQFPAEIKPVYLDVRRLSPTRTSIIGRDPLSPLAASQQPDFTPRPIPFGIPTSVAGSKYASMELNRHHSYLGVTPEDLAVILDELSRRYEYPSPEGFKPSTRAQAFG